MNHNHQTVVGVKGSTAQLNHLLPCVRDVAYLRLGIPRSKMKRTASGLVKAFLLAFFVSFEALYVLPIRCARCFHRCVVLPFVQKKVNKSFSGGWCPHPL